MRYLYNTYEGIGQRMPYMFVQYTRAKEGASNYTLDIATDVVGDICTGLLEQHGFLYNAGPSLFQGVNHTIGTCNKITLNFLIN